MTRPTHIERRASSSSNGVAVPFRMAGASGCVVPLVSPTWTVSARPLRTPTDRTQDTPPLSGIGAHWFTSVTHFDTAYSLSLTGQEKWTTSRRARVSARIAKGGTFNTARWSTLCCPHSISSAGIGAACSAVSSGSLRASHQSLHGNLPSDRLFRILFLRPLLVAPARNRGFSVICDQETWPIDCSAGC